MHTHVHRHTHLSWIRSNKHHLVIQSKYVHHQRWAHWGQRSTAELMLIKFWLHPFGRWEMRWLLLLLLLLDLVKLVLLLLLDSTGKREESLNKYNSALTELPPLRWGRIHTHTHEHTHEHTHTFTGLWWVFYLFQASGWFQHAAASPRRLQEKLAASLVPEPDAGVPGTAGLSVSSTLDFKYRDSLTIMKQNLPAQYGSL